MELLSVCIGFVLCMVGVGYGCLLHMRYVDRRLMPSTRPARPPEPIRLMEKGEKP